MVQLLFHLWGDYIFQSHWMAVNKTSNTLIGWSACLIHCLIYTIPFIFIGSLNAVLVIFITHFLIDKFRLASYLIRVKNLTFTPTGFPDNTPPFLSFWLLIIIDNTLHITINYLALLYL